MTIMAWNKQQGVHPITFCRMTRHPGRRLAFVVRDGAYYVRGWRVVLVVASDGGDDLGGPVGGVLVSEEVDEVFQACAALCGGQCQGLLQG
ncbi:MAG: hypothetical protein WCF33_14555, partial [Pseudonocardiaceae bacterium]